MTPVLASLAMTLAGPGPRPMTLAGPGAKPSGRDGVPGGYWTLAERERPPPDGHERVVIGSILVPLGLAAAAASGTLAYFLTPAHCPGRWPDMTASQCKGWFTFNAIHAGYAGGIALTGAVILALGLEQRRRNRVWHSRRGLAVRPWGTRDGGGVVLGFRF